MLVATTVTVTIVGSARTPSRRAADVASGRGRLCARRARDWRVGPVASPLVSGAVRIRPARAFRSAAMQVLPYHTGRYPGPRRQRARSLRRRRIDGHLDGNGEAGPGPRPHYHRAGVVDRRITRAIAACQSVTISGSYFAHGRFDSSAALRAHAPCPCCRIGTVAMTTPAPALARISDYVPGMPCAIRTRLRWFSANIASPIASSCSRSISRSRAAGRWCAQGRSRRDVVDTSSRFCGECSRRQLHRSRVAGIEPALSSAGVAALPPRLRPEDAACPPAACSAAPMSRRSTRCVRRASRWNTWCCSTIHPDRRAPRWRHSSTEAMPSPRSNSTAHAADVAGQDPCLLVYTSGSTGTPKGALLHHAGIIDFATLCNSLWPADAASSDQLFPDQSHRQRRRLHDAVPGGRRHADHAGAVRCRSSVSS